MKQGDLIAVRLMFGNILLLRYHSRRNDKTFQAYLRFGMESDHATIYDCVDIIELSEVKKILGVNNDS